MEANKYSIVLVHTFKIFSPINLPKCASITQKVGQFLPFSTLGSFMRFFKELD